MIVLCSVPARADLDSIFEFILTENPGAAWSTIERIESQTDRLRDFPALGRPGKVHGTRELVIPNTPYIVAYEIGEGGHSVDILAARHGAQLWPEQFG